MIKDSKGHIWSGGYYNLKCFDLATNSVRLYPGVSSITAIAEKDSHNMWIGTAMGLYLLNRDSGKYEYIKLEAGSTRFIKQITDCYMLVRMEREYLYMMHKIRNLSII